MHRIGQSGQEVLTPTPIAGKRIAGIARREQNAPANYKLAPHWHSQAESLTVISGTFCLGDGDKMDMKKAHALKAGGYHYLPGKAHHFAYTKTPTVVQVNGEGPFDITYINPDDDPSKAAKK